MPISGISKGNGFSPFSARESILFAPSPRPTTLEAAKFTDPFDEDFFVEIVELREPTGQTSEADFVEGEKIPGACWRSENVSFKDYRPNQRPFNPDRNTAQPFPLRASFFK